MSDEEKQDDFNGIMLGLVEFHGEPHIGIKVGNGQINLITPEYMLNVYDQLGEMLYKLGLLDDDEEEDDDETGRMLN